MLTMISKRAWQWLVYAWIIIWPLQTHYRLAQVKLNGQTWEFGYLLIYASDLLLIALLAWQLLKNRQQIVNSLSSHKREWLTGITLIVLAVISLALAESKLLALYGLVRLSLAGGLLWLVNDRRISSKVLSRLIIIAALMQALWGLGQFVTQSAPASKWLGVAEHQASELGVSVIEIIGPEGYPERWLRAYGGLSHPNVLGGLLALAWVLVLIQALQQASNNKWLGLSSRQWWSLAIMLIGAGLALTFSRSAGLAATLASLVIIINHRNQWRKLLEVIAPTIIMLALLAGHYGYLYQARFVSNNRLEQRSVNERSELIKQSYQLIKNHPLTGVGASNFGLTVSREIKPDQEVFAYQPVHNVGLLILAEWGLVVTLALVILLIGLVKTVWSSQERWDKLSLILLVVILMTFDHYLWTQAFGVYLLALVLALVKRQD